MITVTWKANPAKCILMTTLFCKRQKWTRYQPSRYVSDLHGAARAVTAAAGNGDPARAVAAAWWAQPEQQQQRQWWVQSIEMVTVTWRANHLVVDPSARARQLRQKWAGYLPSRYALISMAQPEQQQAIVGAGQPEQWQQQQTKVAQPEQCSSSKQRWPSQSSVAAEWSLSLSFSSLSFFPFISFFSSLSFSS